MSHLSADEIVAAAERTLEGERQAHLDGCDACQMQVLQVRGLLREVQALPVPEPSPLFWDRFSDHVRRAIAAEPPVPRLTRWFQWPVFVPLSALALLVLALASALPQSADLLPVNESADASASLSLPLDGADDEEAHWQLLAALLGDIDADDAEQGMTGAPGAAEESVLQLSSGEQEELLRLLRAELGYSGG